MLDRLRLGCRRPQSEMVVERVCVCPGASSRRRLWRGPMAFMLLAFFPDGSAEHWEAVVAEVGDIAPPVTVRHVDTATAWVGREELA